MPKLLLFFLFVSFNLSAINQSIEFTLATAELPPYVYTDKDKKIKGLFIDMLEQVQKDTAINIKVFIMPWGRAVNEVKKGRIDAIMPTLWSAERAQFLVYPQQSFYTFSESVLIKRIEDDFVFTHLSAIGSDKLIGKTRLVLIDEDFDKLVKQGKLKVYETTKLDEALLMLAQGKVDLVASDGDIALTTIKKLELDKRFTLFPLRQSTSPSFMAFSKQFAAMYDVNKIMTLIKESLEQSSQIH
jgi:polar amino acid transport system substrate-binding protein